MAELWDGITKAVHLIVSLDPEVIDIAGRSLWISATSCAIAALVCLPLGSLIHFRRFWGKRFLISVIQTFFGLPTVAVGLIVFMIFSRAGPLGVTGLLFSPPVMIVGQVVLILPLMLGFIISALVGVDKAVAETAMSLGATASQAAVVTVREARFAIMAAVVVGFGRAISEVGISMMVGGNIAHYTRNITTAMMLETQRGDLELAIALGIILLLIALVINVALNRLQQR